MTLPELRVLAEKAKAWRPMHAHASGKSRSAHCGLWPKLTSVRMNCPCQCGACLGAQRAVEDIAIYVNAAICCFDEEYENLSPHDQSMCEIDALASCSTAVRIAGYFGSPGPVAAFEAGVMEMCR